MDKLLLKEVVVVEGRNDVIAVQKAAECEFIVTHGYRIAQSTLDEIKAAQEKNGVIIFTDPDRAGQIIREVIDRQVSGCKHAYVRKEEAMSKQNQKDIGVENASVEVIQQALRHHCTEDSVGSNSYTVDLMVKAGLMGGEDAAALRNEMGKTLGIGYASGKRMLAKLNRFGIDRLAFDDALQQAKQQLEKL